MFLGEYEYKLDEKGRLPIPPRFRDELKNGLVLTPGVENCILVYPVPEWKKVAATLTTGSLAPSKIRRLNRALFATAFHTPMDSQGRIMLPAPLKEYAGLTDVVVVAGANTYLELWSRERWEEEKALSQEQAWQIIESLEKR
ncbi:MAG: division/cell wall cluster transcriptional repressor MraZ [Chloroflexota bacterium]